MKKHSLGSVTEEQRSQKPKAPQPSGAGRCLAICGVARRLQPQEGEAPSSRLASGQAALPPKPEVIFERTLSETSSANPARIAFEAYFAAEKRQTGKTENKRHCADPTTVLYSIAGRQYFGEVGHGACEVRSDGYTRWNPDRDKQHFYNTQKLPIGELERVMEELLVKPPKHGMALHRSNLKPHEN